MEAEAKLTPIEIGDNLDLEIDGQYPCSDGSWTSTISVDKLLDAQVDKAFKSGIKEVVEWITDNYLIPNPISRADIEALQSKLKEWGIDK